MCEEEENPQAQHTLSLHPPPGSSRRPTASRDETYDATVAARHMQPLTSDRDGLKTTWSCRWRPGSWRHRRVVCNFTILQVSVGDVVVPDFALLRDIAVVPDFTLLCCVVGSRGLGLELGPVVGLTGTRGGGQGQGTTLSGENALRVENATVSKCMRGG